MSVEQTNVNLSIPSNMEGTKKSRRSTSSRSCVGTYSAPAIRYGSHEHSSSSASSFRRASSSVHRNSSSLFLSFKVIQQTRKGDICYIIMQAYSHNEIH